MMQTAPNCRAENRAQTDRSRLEPIRAGLSVMLSEHPAAAAPSWESSQRPRHCQSFGTKRNAAALH